MRKILTATAVALVLVAAGAVNNKAQAGAPEAVAILTFAGMIGLVVYDYNHGGAQRALVEPAPGAGYRSDLQARLDASPELRSSMLAWAKTSGDQALLASATVAPAHDWKIEDIK